MENKIKNNAILELFFVKTIYPVIPRREILANNASNLCIKECFIGLLQKRMVKRILLTSNAVNPYS
jgi:hypothetical protein